DSDSKCLFCFTARRADRTTEKGNKSVVYGIPQRFPQNLTRLGHWVYGIFFGARRSLIPHSGSTAIIRKRIIFRWDQEHANLSCVLPVIFLRI
ncbi:MAG: hypothetical protein EBU49_08580, partial [Proteobacteria bacterium]|nr:hypothetical protein [Pseudomonadota bacterium]